MESNDLAILNAGLQQQGELENVHGACNYYRFMPGRKPRTRGDGSVDSRILLNSARYWQTDLDKVKTDFWAGLALGPGKHHAAEAPVGFEMTPGGLIMTAQASPDAKVIDPRPFYYYEKGKRQKRLFADEVSIVPQSDGSCRAMPRGTNEQDIVYFEVWTGDAAESSAVIQLVNAGLFKHGSVEYAGGTVLVDTTSKKRATQKSKDEALILTAIDNDVSSSVDGRGVAQLVREISYTVNGIVVWSVRLWKIKFAAKSSEAVLVKQYQRYFLLRAPGGRVDPAALEVPASGFEKSFKRLSSHVYVPGMSPIESIVAAEPAAAAA